MQNLTYFAFVNAKNFSQFPLRQIMFVFVYDKFLLNIESKFLQRRWFNGWRKCAFRIFQFFQNTSDFSFAWECQVTSCVRLRRRCRFDFLQVTILTCKVFHQLESYHLQSIQRAGRLLVAQMIGHQVLQPISK